MLSNSSGTMNTEQTCSHFQQATVEDNLGERVNCIQMLVAVYQLTSCVRLIIKTVQRFQIAQRRKLMIDLTS